MFVFLHEQKGLYLNTSDAFSKIAKTEGIKGTPGLRVSKNLPILHSSQPLRPIPGITLNSSENTPF